MKFKYDKHREWWHSSNNDYIVWKAGTTPEGRQLWGARVLSTNDWITVTARSRGEAKQACREYEKLR